jgi:hypothetical protein
LEYKDRWTLPQIINLSTNESVPYAVLLTVGARGRKGFRQKPADANGAPSFYVGGRMAGETQEPT